MQTYNSFILSADMNLAVKNISLAYDSFFCLDDLELHFYYLAFIVSTGSFSLIKFILVSETPQFCLS